jgi:glycosyltransferase involved in cell wall biosynthesis
VPDLRVYLQRATVAVAPIVYGAGIQNKVLEAMACATPVITHPQALSALEAVAGRDLEQATAPGEYAKKILHILTDIEYQRTLGEAGRKYVETHHRWSSITEKLINVYHQMKLL